VSAPVRVPLRHDTKAEPDLLEVGITGQDLGDRQILHDDHGGEIDEGDAWLVVILLAQLPGAAELVR